MLCCFRNFVGVGVCRLSYLVLHTLFLCCPIALACASEPAAGISGHSSGQAICAEFADPTADARRGGFSGHSGNQPRCNVVELLPSISSESKPMPNEKTGQKGDDVKDGEQFRQMFYNVWGKHWWIWPVMYFIFGLICGSGILFQSKYDKKKH